MHELMRCNDIVLVSYVEHLLRQAGCTAVVADQNMSATEGSIGAFPRRILVSQDDLATARAVLRDADLGQWITGDD